MAVENFCLKWNNFHSSILSALDSLQSSEDFVDVTLMCEGLNVKAHKVILSACSPYFRNLFKETPCQHPVIILKDVLHSDLVAILRFMYQGEVLITEDSLTSFLKTAELLQVSGLAGSSPANTPVLPQEQSPVSPALTPPKPQSPAPVVNNHARPKHDKVKMAHAHAQFEIEEPGCSYQAQAQEVVTVKAESDVEFQDMEYTTIAQETIDDSGASADEQSILERSLKAQGKTPHPSKQYPMELAPNPVKSLCPPPLVLLKSAQPADVPHKRKTPKCDEPSPGKCKGDAAVPHGAQSGKCPHCPKVYSNQSALKYHVRLVHSDMLNLFCCHLCPETFEYREGFKVHMWERHCVRN